MDLGSSLLRGKGTNSSLHISSHIISSFGGVFCILLIGCPMERLEGSPPLQMPMPGCWNKAPSWHAFRLLLSLVRKATPVQLAGAMASFGDGFKKLPGSVLLPVFPGGVPGTDESFNPLQ